MTTTETTVEAVQQTLAEYERLAIRTGEWDGTDAPEFSMIGTADSWCEAWSPTEDAQHPEFARATVYRKGVSRPVVVVVRWDEAVPADDDWRALWLRKPVALFGAFTVRAALRRGFRDVIGDRHEPDEPTPDVAPAAAVTPSASVDARDWFADLAEASTPEAVKQLHKDARVARAVTVELETAIRRRLAEVMGRPVKMGGKITVPKSAKLSEGGIVKTGPLVAEESLHSPLGVTPSDLAAALKRSGVSVQPKASKSGRRPQKQKQRHA